MSTETQARDDDLLPGAVVGRAWQTIPTDDPASKPPEEWVKGLWDLDAAVRAAIRVAGRTTRSLTRSGNLFVLIARRPLMPDLRHGQLPAFDPQTDDEEAGNDAERA
jgi:hypothetical protein